jgi:hypothetical protein
MTTPGQAVSSASLEILSLAQHVQSEAGLTFHLHLREAGPSDGL